MKLFKCYFEKKILKSNHDHYIFLRNSSNFPCSRLHSRNRAQLQKSISFNLLVQKLWSIHQIKALHLYFNTVKFHNFWIRFDLWISLHNTTASSETNQTALLWTSINSRFAYKFPKIMNTHIPTQFSLLNPMEPLEFKNFSSTIGEQ